MSKVKSKKSIGFGFIPQESTHHFLIKILDNEIIVHESFLYNENEHNYIAKTCIDTWKWDMIKDALQNEFNNRLKKDNYNKGKWQKETIIEKLMGKEMLLLVWAIESNVTKEDIERAIINWIGLSPEERWYLFTMTNANSGKVYDRKGWRKALKYIFCEN